MAARVEMHADNPARIFISYSRKDMAFADRLEAALKVRGFEPLIDRADIYAYEDWWQRIQALIGRADTIVFVLSPDAVASRVALQEVTYAASLNKRFAPIVYHRVQDHEVPDALRRLSFVFFDDPTCFEMSISKLAEALLTDIGWIRQHTQYGEATRQWTAAGHPIGLLLRSPVLDKAEHWVVTKPKSAPEPTADVLAFIAGSRREAIRRQRRAVTVAVAFLVVAAGELGYLVWSNQFSIRVHAADLLDRLSPRVLTSEAELNLRPKQTLRSVAIVQR